MKTILLVGSNGQIGSVLLDRLKTQFKIIACDIQENIEGVADYYKCDASDYHQMESVFKNHRIDGVINLAGMEVVDNIPPLGKYYEMVNCYMNINIVLLELMKEYGVNKMILASTNHVTDYYEENGYSQLGREINIHDYPVSKSIYGTLKLAAENLCRNYNLNYGIQTIVFRIGTYRKDYDENTYVERWNRTRIETDDLVYYFVKAIEKECNFEIFYLVSDNKDKPWDTTNLKNMFR